jgi:hypothetical protein
MATIQLYDHTVTRFVTGDNTDADTYKVMLCSAATFNATHTTLAAITKTEITASDYTAGGATLTNVALATANTNDAKFDADDITWTVSTGTLTAAYGILYNDTDAGDPPLAFLNFGGNRSVTAPNTFSILWNANGIVLFNYA